MTEATQQFDNNAETLSSGMQGLSASAVPSPSDESDAAKEKRAEFKYRRGFSPRSVDNRAAWGVSEHDTWLDKKHWTETPVGKAGIEFVSRITLGGMFFALMGNSKAMKQLKDDYDPSTYKKDKADRLEKIAKFIDNTLGAGINRAAKMRYGDAQRVVNGVTYKKADMVTRFRSTHLPQEGVNLPGRSLGADMTIVTGDFAAMSVGTGIAREILMNTLNPRERKSWLNKEGEFDPLHVGKKLFGKVWELFTYNAGEDAGVAAVYVFFLRACRNTIDKIAPGFKFGSDSGIDSGGSVVVSDSGRVKTELQVAGAIDLQARFVFYNILTQIYRDIYNGIGSSFTKWRKNNFAVETPEWIKSPETVPERMLETAKGTARYVAISSIRSVLQMMPSVPFFSLFRAPGSKPNGFAVNAEYGAIEGRVEGTDNWVKLRRHGNNGNIVDTRWSNHELAAQHLAEFEAGKRFGTAPNIKPANPFTVKDAANETYDVFGMSKRGNPLHHSATSRVTDNIGRNLHEFAKLPVWHKTQKWFWNITGHKNDSAEMSRQAMLAGVPYASYFAAKVFFREKYVNEQMNLSIGRMLDGIVKWNKEDFSEGLSEIQRTMIGLPFRQTSRKAELIMSHVQNPADKSPIPERWTKENHLEYKEKIAKGDEPDPYELMEQLSNQRADFYRERSRIYREAQHHEEKPENAKESILKKSKPANWKENEAEKKGQYEEFVAAGV